MKKIVLAAMIVVAVAMSAVAQVDFGTLIINHEIATGMSYEGVVAAWREPNSVTRTLSPYEVISNVNAQRSAFRSVVSHHNSMLSSISMSLRP